MTKKTGHASTGLFFSSCITTFSQKTIRHINFCRLTYGCEIQLDDAFSRKQSSYRWSFNSLFHSCTKLLYDSSLDLLIVGLSKGLRTGSSPESELTTPYPPDAALAIQHSIPLLLMVPRSRTQRMVRPSDNHTPIN